MRKIYIIFILVLLAVFSLIVVGNRYSRQSKYSEIANPKNNEIAAPIDDAGAVEKKKQQELLLEEKKLSENILLDVPFLSQAPFAKWDALHEDACEEASLIMVKYFLDGIEMISKEKGEKEIQDAVAFEKKNKYELSVTLDELNEIADKYYNLKTGRVEKNITIQDIKKELSSGKPVIVGAAGKVLPNPNFKNGGPNYHMLVIIGYDEKGFITNDPGTRLGKSFRYSFDDLYKSIHDWNPKNILNGEKNYLVFD
jgi:uncharacterized protein YvpB